MYKSVIVGVGFIGAMHIDALRRQRNLEIVALCDSFNAEEKAKQYGIKQWFSNYIEMFEKMKPDVVHICTPNSTHYDIAKSAIERGINFICEKPFTTTIEQAIELEAMAKEKGIKGFVNFHSRYYPMIREVREMIKAGELGDIFTIHGEYFQDWLLYDTDYSWRLESEKVGQTRAIADIGSHWFDLAEYTTGFKIDKVCARFSRVYEKRKKPVGKLETFSKSSVAASYDEIDIDTEDAAFVLLEFSNGAIGSLSVSQVFSGKKNTCAISIAGNRKSVVWTSESQNDLFIGYRDKPNEIITKDPGLVHARTSEIISCPGGHVEGFPEAFKQGFGKFYESLESDGIYEYATIKDGLHDMRICEAIFKSSRTLRWESV